ncbi:RNA polymerase sigma-70 factor (ECF subfamily) [Cerasibacillus quisquiliarum]|uniref:RNA polymerase sigma factor 70 region 4 type 2 domain-containing protein n=1 Tax=Cerasibacillus quisquiliarum TaxID=227865 RepID=A0A511UUH3_9BACI|nr:sigma-70 family RNA polymerase sigma factor [Cerasibacillus quisquiliarum]MBB5144860.1 RNA polymerase sigma-70 factor (ECF subfamily) [Cerasibacillus quisquiliarum]GEN30249.1 hypothetical protein CQU01_04870 [Cerasibacillus quisquiliarum]
MSWVDRLIIEYEEGRKSLYAMKDALGDSELDRIDKTQINSMIREISDVIKWLKTGRDPFKLRGIDRRSAYQKRVLYDMDLFPSLDIVPDSLKEDDNELTNEEKELVADILLVLSPRERQCYLLHFVNQLSFEEIADELKLSKGTIQSYIERAKAKIKNKVSCLTDAV